MSLQYEKFKILLAIFQEDMRVQPDFYMLCYNDYAAFIEELLLMPSYNHYQTLPPGQQGYPKIDGIMLAPTDAVGKGDQCFVMKRTGAKMEFTSCEKTYQIKG